MADPEREPVTASDFFHKGLEELQRGDYAEALKSIDNAISRNYFGADVALTKAEVLFELRRHDDALEWLDRALAMDSSLQGEVSLLRARVHFEQGAFSRALSALNRAMADSGSPGETWLLKGMVLSERGDHQKAMAALEEARALTGDDTAKLADVLYWEGRTLRAMHRFADATARLERVLALDPKHAEGYNELAEAYRVQGMLDVACEIYERGIKENPDESIIRNDYGNTLRDLGRLEDALKQLNKAAELDESVSTCIFNRATIFERMERWEDAIADYKTVLTENPEDAEARLRMVDIYARIGKFKEAREAYFSLSDAERDRPDVQDVYARYLNRRARDLELRGVQTTALEIYRELLELNPDLLDFDHAGKQFASTEVRCRRVLKQLTTLEDDDPNRSLIPLIRGMLRFRVGPRDQALHELEDCLQGEYADVARTHLAEIYAVDRRDPERALQCLDLALKLRPNYVQALWGKAEVLDEQLHDPAGALQCYQAILRIIPGNPAVLDALGNLYLRTGENYRALQAYRQLLEVTPRDRAVRRSQAIARMELGQVGLAINELERIRDEDPYDPITRVTLAAALCQSNQLEQAASLLDQLASSSGSGYDWSIEAIMREVRAEVFNKQRRHTEALRTLRTMRGEDLSASGLLQRGVAQIATGNLEGGRASFKEVIRDMPQSARVSREARIELAKLHLHQKRTAAARELLEDTLRYAPFSRRARVLLIWALRELGEVEESDHQDGELLAVEELRPVVRQLLRGEFEEAREELSALSRRRPNHPETLYWQTAAELGCEAFEDALLTMRRLVELEPKMEERARRDPFFDQFVFSDLISDTEEDSRDWLDGIDFDA